MTFGIKLVQSSKEMDAIMQLRYKVLREPWKQPMETATDELESLSINAFIADENGNAIACGRLHEKENKIGQIRFMAVDKAHRGKGLGKLTTDFLEEKGKAIGIKKIELQARENVVKFYESCGYSLKEKTFLLWGEIQHYLMEKKL